MMTQSFFSPSEEQIPMWVKVVAFVMFVIWLLSLVAAMWAIVELYY